ncbi:MAG: glycosyltransferase, partial [Deltaproteobacteria bacterium]
MKICFINRYFYPFIGGVEFHIQNLSKKLIELGHDVYIITSNKNRQNPAEILSKAEIYEEIKVIRVKSFKELKEELIKGGFEVVHSHFSRTVFSAAGIILAKKYCKNARIIFTPHCFYPAKNINSFLKKIIFDNTLGINSFRKADTMICLTENDKADAVRLGMNKDKITIIPNSINFSEFNNKVISGAFCERFKINKYILFVGRIDYVKRIDFLIEGMKYLKLDGYNLAVIGAGEENQVQKLKELAKTLEVEENVKFCGKVSFDELASAYQSCELLALPSSYEGLPTVILEAMALGKVVAAAASGGTSFVINHGENGFLFEYNNLEDYCKVVKNLKKYDISKIGEKAKETVKQNYSWESNVYKIIDVYRANTKVRIGNIYIDNLSMDECIARIEDLIRSGRKSYVVTPNVDHIVKLQRDEEFLEAYRG